MGACAPQGTLLVCPQEELWYKKPNIPGAGSKGSVDPLLQTPTAITPSYRQIIIRRRMFSSIFLF